LIVPISLIALIDPLPIALILQHKDRITKRLEGLSQREGAVAILVVDKGMEVEAVAMVDKAAVVVRNPLLG
jgi:hypothetical protein